MSTSARQSWSAAASSCPASSGTDVRPRTPMAGLGPSAPRHQRRRQLAPQPAPATAHPAALDPNLTPVAVVNSIYGNRRRRRYRRGVRSSDWNRSPTDTRRAAVRCQVGGGRRLWAAPRRQRYCRDRVQHADAQPAAALLPSPSGTVRSSHRDRVDLYDVQKRRLTAASPDSALSPHRGAYVPSCHASVLARCRAVPGMY